MDTATLLKGFTNLLTHPEELSDTEKVLTRYFYEYFKVEFKHLRQYHNLYYIMPRCIVEALEVFRLSSDETVEKYRGEYINASARLQYPINSVPVITSLMKDGYSFDR